MQLFAGSSYDFVEEAVQKQIAARLGDSYYDYYRFRASASEFTSWRNSLSALAYQLRYSGVRDHGVVLEMQLPLSSARLDAFVFGRSPEGRDSAVLVELKQWSEASASEWDDCVETWLGGSTRKVLHPCVQARSYAQYLQDMHSAFDEENDGISIAPCAWLHNMHPGAAAELHDHRFAPVLAEVPLFLGSDADAFKDYFARTVGAGNGLPVMERALTGKHAPSRNLLQQTAAMVRDEPRYRLIDDQIIAFNAVLGLVRRAQKDKRERAVVVVKGGTSDLQGVAEVLELAKRDDRRQAGASSNVSV